MTEPTELRGSRGDIGMAHGRQHADRIRRGIVVYERLFQDFVSCDWSQARRQALTFLPAIERGFPAILDEVDGLARGAGLEFADILALNCRSEISLTRASGGCSAFALHREGTQWLAQNWDWRADQFDNIAALRIEAPDAPPLVTIAEAGMVAKIGMNAQGIGVCLNAIRSRTCGEGLPIHFALRKILESEHYAAARQVVENDRVASPAHFLIASGDGQANGFEVHPGAPGAIPARDGQVAHTNHLYAETVTACIPDYPQPDSHIRLGRLEQRLEAPLEPSPEALFDILSDHENAPLSLCCHTQPERPEAERMETLFSVVMNLSERVLHWRHGKPCQSREALRIAF